MEPIAGVCVSDKKAVLPDTLPLDRDGDESLLEPPAKSQKRAVK